MQDRLCPGVDPGLALLSDQIRFQSRRLQSQLSIFLEHLWQFSGRIDRIDVHLQGHILLERNTQHEIDKFLRQLEMLRASQYTHEFDLPEACAWRGDRGRWGF